jgi:hypothetical protein
MPAIPNPKSSKTEGRITYDARGFDRLPDKVVLETGQMFAERFPDWNIWVTAGPYRYYSVGTFLNWQQHVIAVDLYSSRGLDADYVIAAIESVAKRIEAGAQTPGAEWEPAE